MPRVAMMVDAEAPKSPRRPILKPAGRPRSCSQEKHVRFLMPEKLPDAVNGGARKVPSITSMKLSEFKLRRRRKRAMGYLSKSKSSSILFSRSPTIRDRTSRVDASVHELYRNYFPDAPEGPRNSSNGGVTASDPTRRPLFPTSPRDKSKSPRNILLSPNFIGSRSKRLRQLQLSVDEKRQQRENASPLVNFSQRRLDMDFVSKPIGSPALNPSQRKPSQSCRNLMKACAQDVFDWATSDRSSSSAILSENGGGAPIISESSVSTLEKESCPDKLDGVGGSCASTPSASQVMQGLTDDSTFQQGETKDVQVTSTVASQAASAHCTPSASVEVPGDQARASLQSSESLTDEKREVDAGRALGPIPADARQEAQPAEEALLASAEEPHKIEGNCIETPINAVVTAECERNRTEDPGLPPLPILEGPVAPQASMCDVFSPTKGLLSPMKGLVVASPQQQQLHKILHSLTPDLVHTLQKHQSSEASILAALGAVESSQAVVPVEKRDVALQTDPEIEHNHSSNKGKMELEEGEFYVERILSHRNDANGEREFLIRWHGHSASDDSWEPESNLISGAEKLVFDYFRMKQEIVSKQEQELLNLPKNQVLVILAGSGSSDVEDGFWLFELVKSYEVASDDFDALLEGFYYTRLKRNLYRRMQPKILDLVQLDNVLPGPQNAQLIPRFQRVAGHPHLRRLTHRSLEHIEEALTKLEL